MRRTTLKLAGFALLAFGPLFDTAQAQSDGYYYQARSLYVTPPIYANLSVFGQPPIVVYEPVITYPAPVAGYFTPISNPAPVAAPQALVGGPPAMTPAAVPSQALSPPQAVGPGPAMRVRERQFSGPFRTRYEYTARYPGGLEYKYRYKRVGNQVRFKEKWDD
ncbi:MAG TPA: hypothetical protein VKU82_02880 [Planctomycetaceae bacterium]|nr:hypothetical protein [Planctomycetaceae bacterium]